MEHTKGEWEISPIDNLKVIVKQQCIRQGQSQITVCAIWYEERAYWGGQAEAEANAHLIAAAPDLLEACKSLVDELEGIEQDDGITACQCLITGSPPCNYCKAKQVIAEAEGE